MGDNSKVNSMNWNQLLSVKRLGLEGVNQSSRKRTEFQRDYDRVIFSSPFRRLQNKTQVFPLPGSVFVHNRLTHSLEVASVGRSLGAILADSLETRLSDNILIREIPSIIATACLAHDMGNPPFGHSGEAVMSRYFTSKEKEYKQLFSDEEWADITHFEGNANTLRLLAHQFSGRVEGGLRLTYSTLASIIKYPCSAENGHNKTNIHRKKYGYFQVDKPIFDKLAKELGLIAIDEQGSYVRHPLVYLVEAADDICYTIIDIEDAHRLGVLSYQETYDLLFNFIEKVSENLKRTLNELKNDQNEQIAVLRATAIGALIQQCGDAFIKHEEEILHGEFNQALDNCLTGSVKEAYAAIRKISPDRIYNARQVIEVELAGHKVLAGLMEEFIPAILNPDDEISKKYIFLIPKQFQTDSTSPYLRVMAVLDFISGMTDLYAVDLYRKIKSLSL